MLTAVVMNWRRPGNVVDVCRGYDRSLVPHVLVWDGTGTCPDVDAQVVRGPSRDLGLYARFALGLLAPTEAVLIQDDDIELGVDTVRALGEAWTRDKTIVHGIFGRRPKPDGSYAQDVDRKNAEVEVVLTRALVCSRSLLSRFFVHLDEFEDIQRDASPRGNGEDIILSYVAMRYSASANRVYNYASRELPAPHAIHARPGHKGHRTKLMRFCERWRGR